MPWKPTPTPHRVKEKQSGRTHSNRALYNSTRWKKLSKLHKSHNPLCVECLKLNLYEPVRVTDHIVPVNDGGEPYAWDNLQSLCNSCHNRKSGREAHKNKKNND